MPKCDSAITARMNRRVDIQSVTRTSDGQGGFTESWTTDATVWAYITQAKGYEKYQAMQLETPISHKITIRYRDGVTTAQRMVHEGNVFNIKEVLNPDMDFAFLEIKALQT
jgi:SPP1 family predicted phage head-tail adaptor